MARRRRCFQPNSVYHLFNRGVRRAVLFETSDEYCEFEQLLIEGLHRFTIRLLAYSAMPNHWHLVVWVADGTHLQKFMHRVQSIHAQRWHARRETTGTGHVYQNRYKAVLVDSDERVRRVCRYVERNPLRARLVTRAQDWRWSSLWRRCNHCCAGVLTDWPFPVPMDWVEYVNRPLREEEIV